VKTFWMVWSNKGSLPAKSHDFKTSAKSEAKRLALANPQAVFVILESIGHYATREPVQFTKHEKEHEQYAMGPHLECEEGMSVLNSALKRRNEKLALAESEIQCLRSVLSEWDADKSCYVQMSRADEFAQERKK
jgi:hypothetical protein